MTLFESYIYEVRGCHDPIDGDVVKFGTKTEALQYSDQCPDSTVYMVEVAEDEDSGCIAPTGQEIQIRGPEVDAILRGEACTSCDEPRVNKKDLGEAVTITHHYRNPNADPSKVYQADEDKEAMLTSPWVIEQKRILGDPNSTDADRNAALGALKRAYAEAEDEYADVADKYSDTLEKDLGTQYQIWDYDENGNLKALGERSWKNPMYTGAVDIYTDDPNNYSTPRVVSDGEGQNYIPTHGHSAKPSMTQDEKDLLNSERAMTIYQQEQAKKAKDAAKEVARFNRGRNLFKLKSESINEDADLCSQIQAQLDQDISEYGKATSDTKLKAERCGFKIQGNKVVQDQEARDRAARVTEELEDDMTDEALAAELYRCTKEGYNDRRGHDPVDRRERVALDADNHGLVEDTTSTAALKAKVMAMLDDIDVE